ncbi:type II secretion system protein M [Fontimonas sp. SYSU GA230001]|uniref:type II secretion system protein M n=1 Tax=Fontimonas sp. SYSU GA230001 TaxID=3142450 RepID=UPI0032B44A8B
MKTLVEQLREALLSRSPRERIMLLAAALVVACTLLYLLVWEPLVTADLQRKAALERARLTAARIEEIAVRVQSMSAGRRTDRNTSLLAAVDQTSRSPTLGKAPSRLQPEGDREVKIWIDDVPFDNLLRWLQELDTRYGITPASAEIERAAAAGVVNVRLTLVRG